MFLLGRKLTVSVIWNFMFLNHDNRQNIADRLKRVIISDYFLFQPIYRALLGF